MCDRKERVCSINKCRKVQTDDFKVFDAPPKSDLRTNWLKFISLCNNVRPQDLTLQTLFVCEDHFHKTDLEESMEKRQQKFHMKFEQLDFPLAVPKIFPRANPQGNDKPRTQENIAHENAELKRECVKLREENIELKKCLLQFKTEAKEMQARLVAWTTMLDEKTQFLDVEVEKFIEFQEKKSQNIPRKQAVKIVQVKSLQAEQQSTSNSKPASTAQTSTSRTASTIQVPAKKILEGSSPQPSCSKNLPTKIPDHKRKSSGTPRDSAMAIKYLKIISSSGELSGHKNHNQLHSKIKDEKESTAQSVFFENILGTSKPSTNAETDLLCHEELPDSETLLTCKEEKIDDDWKS